MLSNEHDGLAREAGGIFGNFGCPTDTPFEVGANEVRIVAVDNAFKRTERILTVIREPDD